MSSVTGMGFSTYTNHQTQRTNTDQARVTTNTTFGEAFNKAISTPKPSEQASHSQRVEANTYSASAYGEYVARTGNKYIDENGNEADIRWLAIPEWRFNYFNNGVSDRHPLLRSLSDHENYILSENLRDIFLKTLDDLRIEINSDQYTREVLLDPIRSEEVHEKFWENIQNDERMEKYVNSFYI